jgi:cyclic dehypoxanthinyl futalosine synthase
MKTATQDLLRDKVYDGERITPEEGVDLLRDWPLTELAMAADHLRRKRTAPKVVTYIIDRNVNYSNVCHVDCSFCAFYRHEGDKESYVLSNEEIGKKIEETLELGGTQILMQGGLHPNLPFNYYTDLLRYIKANYPIHIHAFSPPEILHFADMYKMSLEQVLSKLKEAGLGSIPGGGAEILVDRVRDKISPLKCKSDAWLSVMETGHKLGLRSSATMMFGHVETLEERIEHLRRFRDLQDKTKGFFAFIPWTFQPPSQVNPVGRQPAGAHEFLKTLAVSRIFLDNFTNIQSSWLTQGHKLGQIALSFGANDMGSIMIEENVVSSAGTFYKINTRELRRLIADAGYAPRQRDVFYNLLPEDPRTWQ